MREMDDGSDRRFYPWIEPAEEIEEEAKKEDGNDGDSDIELGISDEDDRDEDDKFMNLCLLQSTPSGARP
jgi:hypothetical protein